MNLEKNKKGEQFRIIDRAKLPSKPSEPDIRKLFLLTIAAGLGLGGGVIFLLEFLDHTVKQPKDIESEVGLPVLVSMPLIYSTRQKIWHRANQVLTFFSVVLALALCACFALVSLKGTEQTLALIKGLI